MFGFTKIIKLTGLLLQNPTDFIYIPISIIFGWFHGLIKIYALLTLHEESDVLIYYLYGNANRSLDFMG